MAFTYRLSALNFIIKTATFCLAVLFFSNTYALAAEQTTDTAPAATTDVQTTPTTESKTPQDTSTANPEPSKGGTTNVTGGPIDPTDQTLGQANVPKVSNQEGSLSYDFAIDVPPGRNNLTPDIKLHYSSTNKSLDTVIGTGWAVNIPFIQRFSKTGVDQLYTVDTITSSLDGELVNQGSGVYKPRTENGSFLQYRYASNTWIVTDKNGVVYQFGTTTQARQSNPADANKIYTWMLELVKDTNGNTISYTYFKDQGKIYPDTISYNQENLYQIKFLRTAKYIPTTTYNPGFLAKTSYSITEIDVYKSSSLIASYVINVSAGIVTGFQKSGNTNGTTTTLPALQVAYTTSSGGWSGSSSNLPAITLVPQGVRYADVNGDGLNDLVYAYQSASGVYQNTTYLNTGSGWTASSTWTISSPYAFYNYNAAQRNFDLVDVNGDGLPDIAEMGNTTSFNVHLNTGSGWSTTTYETVTGAPVQPLARQFADLNNDGLSDLVYAYKSSAGTVQNSTYINTGSSFVYNSVWQIPTTYWFQSYTGAIRNFDLADMNGDGLPDIVEIGNNTSFNMYLNNGAGWNTGTSTYASLTSYPVQPLARQIVDVDGDGLSDVVYAYKSTASVVQNATFINPGTSGAWSGVSNNAWQIPTTNWFVDYNGGGNNFDLADINGDTLPDIIHYATQSTSNLNVGVIVSNLSQVTTPQTGKTAFQYTIASTDDTSKKVPLVAQILKSVVTNDSNGIIATTTYAYKNAGFYFGTSTDRRFTGFGEVTQINPDGSKVISKYHQANGQTGNEPTDTYAKISKPYEESITDASNNMYQLKRYSYTDTALGTTSTSSLLTAEVLLQYNASTSHVDTAKAYAYDSYGNVVTETQYGTASSATDGTFSDIGTDKRTVQTTFTNDTTNYIVGLPTSITVTNNASSQVSRTNYKYDAKANPLEEGRWISGSAYATTSHAFNSYGLKTSDTDARGNSTTYSYDINNLYPATTTNALTQTVRYTYDYSTGKPLTITDSNNLTKTYVYDGLGRILEEDVPDPSSGTSVVKSRYVYNDTTFPNSVKKTNYLTATTSQEMYVYTDGFGREIQSRSAGEFSNQFTAKDTVYGVNGLVKKSSLPYFSTEAFRTSPTATSSLYTTINYDPLGRATSSVSVVGTAATTYSGWNTIETNVLGKSKDTTVDAFGRIIQIDEHNGTSTYTTVYDWDSNSNLIKITDALGNVRSAIYDGLSRRTSIEDLHAVGDATYGSWSYMYDPVGNIATSTDPKGQVVAYTYDAVNRPVAENYTGTAGIEVSYTYDSCTRGVGQLCSVTNNVATTSYTYAYNTLPATETKTIGSIAYTISYTYNRLGNKTLITYPDSSEVRYTYNKGSMLERIEQHENGSGYRDIVSNFDYSPVGQVTYQVNGNGSRTARTYDANELYRLRSILTVSSTTPTNIYGTGGGGLELQALETSALLDSTTTDQLFIPSVSSSTPADTAAVDVSETAAPAFADTAVTTSDALLPTTTDIETLQSRTTDRITRQMDGKGSYERANIKSTEMYNVDLSARTRMEGGEHDFQMVDKNKIDGGVELFVRAWNSAGEKVGFGTDGSVEIERFRIMNPPVLVLDANGTIVRESYDPEFGTTTFRYREDPKAALLQVLEQVMKVKKQKFTSSRIENGKVGKTTTIIYPDGNPENKTHDAYLEKDTTGANRYNTTHNASSADQYQDTYAFADAGIRYDDRGDIIGFNIRRSQFLFDTSIIGTNLIDSATLSLYATDKLDTFGRLKINVVPQTVASNTQASLGDYDNFSTTRLSTDLVPTTFPAYQNLPLSTGGLSYINKAGVTAFMAMTADDIDNAGLQGQQYVSIYHADQTGTANDPMLVIEHHESVSPSGATTTATSYPIYDDALASGWVDWSWGSTVDLNQATTVASGAKAIKFTATTTGGTLNLHTMNSGGASETPYSTLEFDINGGANGGQSIWLYFTSTAAIDYGCCTVGSRIAGGIATSTWKHVSIPLSDFGTTTLSIDSIRFQMTDINKPVYIDNVKLIGSATSAASIKVQDLAYTYDALGNITKIIDRSDTHSAATTTYTYDDLSRLTSASTTQASTTPYQQTYSYNAIGNITSKSDIGSYLYQGATGTNYANPHAPTSINGITQNYDNSGNLTYTSLGLVNTWNYRNRLLSSGKYGATTTYQYGASDERVTKTTNGIITKYPSQFVDVVGTTSTKHIYAGDTLVATIDGTGSTSSTYFNHPDHLGSTAVVTNASGSVSNLYNYYPYGSTRIDESFSTPTASQLYADSVVAPWTNGSWGTTITNSTSTIYSGSSALKVVYNVTWGGVSYTRAIDTTPYSSLDFYVYISATSTPNLYLYFSNASGTALQTVNLNAYVKNGLTTNTWQHVIVPLSVLGIPIYNNTLTFNIEADQPTTVYYDQIQFLGNNGPLTSDVYTDSLNTYWWDYSWNTTISNSSTTVYNGNSALKVVYNVTWGGLAYSRPLTTTPYSTFDIAVYIPGTTTPNLYLYFQNASGTTLQTVNLNKYTPGGLTTNTWKRVSVPLSALGITSYNNTLTFNIESDTPGTVYYDQIQFVGTSTGHTEPNQFIGQDYDRETDLNYLNARYYDGKRGQFISQDPMFWSNNQNLANPQDLNSYSYADDNPINRKDPSGLASVNGSVTAIKENFVKLLTNYVSFLQSARSNPVGTARSIGAGVANTASNLLFNPGGMAYDAAVSAQSNVKRFMNGSDAVQDQMIGSGIVFAGEMLVSSGAGRSLRALPGETLVCRGGACGMNDFIKGTGVKINPNGTLSGVSVVAGLNGESKEQLLKMLPPSAQGIGKFTTVSQILNTSANGVQTGSRESHFEMSGLTPSEYVDLFK